MLYLSWSLSLWILFAASVPLHRLCSHCNCGILPLCIQKVLNWIEYRGSEKIPLLQLFVHVCSLCNLSCLLSTASSLDKAMFSLLRGLLLSFSSLLLALNFNSAFCCCPRGVLPGENLHLFFECRGVVFAFLGQLHWRKLLVIHR